MVDRHPRRDKLGPHLDTLSRGPENLVLPTGAETSEGYKTHRGVGVIVVTQGAGGGVLLGFAFGAVTSVSPPESPWASWARIYTS